MGASSVAFWLIILDERDVFTHYNNFSSSCKSTGIPIFSITSKEWFNATANPSDIQVGWIPYSKRLYAASNKAPERTTTEVVPSPASMSYAFEL